MPQNILITAMAMFLGWQVARVLLFCAALPDRVELHCELDGTVTCEGVHMEQVHLKATQSPTPEQMDA